MTEIVYDHALTRLFIAACKEDLIEEAHRLFMTGKIDTSYGGCKILVWSVKHNKPSVFRILLLDSNLDKCLLTNYCIEEAFSKEYEEIAQMLIDDPRITQDQGGNNALYFASKCGNLSMIRSILKSKKYSLSVNYYRATRIAAEYKYENIVKELLSKEEIDYEMLLKYITFTHAINLIETIKLEIEKERSTKQSEPKPKDENVELVKIVSQLADVLGYKLVKKEQ